MAITLNRPSHFDALEFVFGPVDEAGRRTDTAPCGCARHLRFVKGGPLSGHCYGDARYDVCDAHTRTCPDCGQQTWPHYDCVCDA